VTSRRPYHFTPGSPRGEWVSNTSHTRGVLDTHHTMGRTSILQSDVAAMIMSVINAADRRRVAVG
jgi:hypothetical protein